MKNIAIFASGSGTNAENIIRHFENHPYIRVAAVFTNNAEAGVIERAKRLNVQCIVFSREQLCTTFEVSAQLRRMNVNYIVLAGFLWLMPQRVVEEFGRNMLNIHPSLLPKYGGKGMYGMRVHEAVIAAGECLSGITIHRVNEFYDDGDVVCRQTCEVRPDDTPETLAQRVHELEYEWYPKTIEADVMKTI